jgi:hypothetical protein
LTYYLKAHRDSLSVTADIYDVGVLLTETYGVGHFMASSTLKQYSVRKDQTLKFGITEGDFEF